MDSPLDDFICNPYQINIHLPTFDFIFETSFIISPSTSSMMACSLHVISHLLNDLANISVAQFYFEALHCNLVKIVQHGGQDSPRLDVNRGTGP
jgi:hypothetical protein